MKWIPASDQSVKPLIGVEYLVWVDQVQFDEEGEEITGGYAQVAKLKHAHFGWVETMDGLTLNNVTHYAEIEKPI